MGYCKWQTLETYQMKNQKRWARDTVGGSTKNQNKSRIKLFDGYHTPLVAVETLLEKEDVADYVWEPAAGFFKIVNPLRKDGIKVFTSDICDWHDKMHQIKDFSKYQKAPKPLQGKMYDILTNPPFSKASMFVEKAMQLLPKGGRLYLLLRVQFLEGNKRYHLFKKYPPKRIWTYSFRLPRMHRFFYKGESGGSLLAFAWFVWEKNYKGPTIVDWIEKPKK
jgi:hypothetical protein